MEQDAEITERLERRLGIEHARQRLGIEGEHEAIFGHGINFFHPENWYSTHSMLRAGLVLTGLYGRGNRNTERIQVRHNRLDLEGLPEEFDGYSILQISDLHVELNPGAMRRLLEIVPELAYDICVLTGDFRAKTFGPFEGALEGLARVVEKLRQPVYGVLGNHDTIRMLPAIEAMGVRMLLNESEALVRGGQRVHLAGVDDAHYYRADDLVKAREGIAKGEISILLSHTPEIYREADEAGFNVMLSGHTHGGQICLPGGVPVTLDASLPRSLGAGAWQYEGLAGYTSVGVGTSIVAVRFNCLPEVTVHHLARVEG
jgi:predicted MPP superfamily phosphohydrolase